MKVVYIAHPIAGNVKGNMRKILSIVRKINKKIKNVTPLVPYYTDLLTLNDSIPEERSRGIRNNRAILRKGCVDELWVYGDYANSKGCMEEIAYCKTLGIPVVYRVRRCATPNCLQDTDSVYCSKCRGFRYRRNHPLKTTHQILKDNAKRRGVYFNLTLQEFKEFCERTNYLEHKGRLGDDMTIDRIDPTKGYIAGNLQVLTRRENSKKQKRESLKVMATVTTSGEDVPF